MSNHDNNIWKTDRVIRVDSTCWYAGNSGCIFTFSCFGWKGATISNSHMGVNSFFLCNCGSLSLISKRPVHLLLSLPCKWNGKTAGETHNKSKPEHGLVRNAGSAVMLNQVCERISTLSLKALVGLQYRHQHCSYPPPSIRRWSARTLCDCVSHQPAPLNHT